MLDLKTPIENLQFVGPVYARRLEKLGIETTEDLLRHYPFRYEDFSLTVPIALAPFSEPVTLRAEIKEIKNIYTRWSKKLTRGVIADETGELPVVWFNQHFITKNLKKGDRVSLSGKIGEFGGKKTLINPEYELVKAEGGAIHTGGLVPVYPETYGVSSKWLRAKIAPLLKTLLPQIGDYLSDKIREDQKLLGLSDSLKEIHFPQNWHRQKKARERLAFDELFLSQIASGLRKKLWRGEKTLYKMSVSDFQPQISQFISSLPFELTGAQRRALHEILSDLNSQIPMNRLLEGDVGSGKTVVAAVAMYLTHLHGYRSVLMAPTEILAQQHYNTITNLLSPFGITVELITGRTCLKKTTRRIGGQNLKLTASVLIGTHALLGPKANFENVALVVIDEQHRFGVEQRTKLRNRGVSPHLLTMTATPIPRTIALTLYGELNLSVIDELPPNRQKVKTWLVPENKRVAGLEWVRENLKNGGQAFYICPFIEESESLVAVKAAKKEYEHLSQKIFPDLKIGLLHGRMKNKDKDEALEKFRRREFDLLVATPVVEVGLDIPGATLMIIEAAERFGLAQLHQLRGRVGRGQKQSYCLLFAQNRSSHVIARLKAMERNHSGMELAELDLKLRGPGDIYGLKQHGEIELKIADFSDIVLIEKAKLEAEKVINQLDDHPLLKKLVEDKLQKKVEPN